MKNATKNNKSVSKTSFWLLLIGFFFFITPTPLGFDLFPDAIGCIFLYFGLSQLAFFDSSVEEAKKGLIYLFGAELIHLLLTSSMFLSPIGSNRLLAVSFLAIVQCILYIIIFKKLFCGISYFTMRNNFENSLKRSDGVAFLTYLSFFVRVAAMLLPELISILELRLNIELDPTTYNAIVSLVGVKPVIILLLSAISIGISIAWYISIVKMFKTLRSEAGKELDERYKNEYTSRPERVLPKKLRAGAFAFYFALIFTLDISFDKIRIIPASATFLLLFASAFIFKGISEFKQTKKYSLFAFVCLLATEVFRTIYIPYDAVVIYETELWIVITSLILCLITVPFCLLAIRSFLSDLKNLANILEIKPISTAIPWFYYCLTLTLWAAGFVIPYFYPYIMFIKLIAASLFIWQGVKTVGIVKDEGTERYTLYNP